MNWRNVKLIFFREIRDQLRDRRTLFMIAILPLLLYPVMGIGMVYMTTMFREQPRNVVILGAEHLPDFADADRDAAATAGLPGWLWGTEEASAKRTPQFPQLLDGKKFDKAYFRIPGDAEKLHVVTDRNTKPDDAELALLVDKAREIGRLLKKRDAIHKESDAYQAASQNISRLMAEANLQVLVIVPEGFSKNLHAINKQLSHGATAKSSRPQYRGLTVLRNSADEKSQIAYRRTKEVIDSWEESVLKSVLRGANLPESVAKPVAAEYVEAAEKSQISANVWSKLFPALLVIMAVTGAFYPAVDLAAGEKERGTMETLLICPASRTDIVVGKFFTIMTFSMSTALLNLASMGLTGNYMVSMASGAMSSMSGLEAPSLQSLFWVVILLIPLAALFSALSLALATFARSSKEGQYYLTPLLMVTMGLTVFCLSPAVEIEAFYSVMPIVGPTLLLKELLSSNGTADSLVYAVPVLVMSFLYSLLALWWAVEQFSREDILFREAERFDLRLWVKHLLRDKEATPSFSEGAFCFVMIMLLQFGAMRFMQNVIVGASAETRQTVMVQLLMVQQLVIIATPAILMGVMLTSNPRLTFRLNWPKSRYLALAVALPLVLHPVTLELSAALQQWFFPPLPPSVMEQVSVMSDSSQPLWFVLLAFALAPAICEETAFRGFILSGFSRSKRYGLAVVLSSVAFGVMHIIPQQVYNAALLGIVLGFLAIRSNSLLPGIVFHFVYNALSVANGRLATSAAAETLEQGAWRAFVVVDGGNLRFTWATVMICGVLAASLLRTLFPRTPQTLDPMDDYLPDGVEIGKPNANAGAGAKS